MSGSLSLAALQTPATSMRQAAFSLEYLRYALGHLKLV